MYGILCACVCINSVNSWEKQWLLVHLLSVCGDEVEHPLLPWRSCTWVCASWDLTESSQTEWFPVWAACKTRELLELKIALGLMVWALPEPGRVLDLRRKRTSGHQQRTERIREWRHGPGEGGFEVLCSVVSLILQRFHDLISCFILRFFCLPHPTLSPPAAGNVDAVTLL